MQNMELVQLKSFEKYHQSFIFFLKFSKNKKFLFSGGKDKTFKIMNLDNLELVSEIPFCNNIFWALEHHSNLNSYIFIIGRNPKITRKVQISGNLKEGLRGRF